MVREDTWPPLQTTPWNEHGPWLEFQPESKVGFGRELLKESRRSTSPAMAVRSECKEEAKGGVWPWKSARYFVSVPCYLVDFFSTPTKPPLENWSEFRKERKKDKKMVAKYGFL